jgi:hypothetical protein
MADVQPTTDRVPIAFRLDLLDRWLRDDCPQDVPRTERPAQAVPAPLVPTAHGTRERHTRYTSPPLLGQPAPGRPLSYTSA